MVEWKKLGEVCEIGTGSNNREDACEGGTYPFFVRSQDVLRINSYLFDEEAILIPGEGGIGDIFHYIKGKYGLHQRTYRVHPISKKIDGKFVYYYLFANFKDYINQKSYKATAASIRKPMLLDFPIVIPSISEQERIVGILDTFTSSIEILKAQISLRRKQYEHYRDKLLDLEGKPGVEMKTLGEICGIYDGTHQTPKYTEEGIKFVSVENIKDLFASNKYISREDYEHNYKTKPQRNDILMTRIGDVGTCAVINSDKPLAYYVSLSLLRPNKDEVISSYIKHLLESQTGKREIRKRTLLTAVPLKINLGDIGKLIIPLPSLQEQSRIVSILDEFEASIKNLEAQLKQRQKQYEYYREKLLTFE